MVPLAIRDELVARGVAMTDAQVSAYLRELVSEGLLAPIPAWLTH